MKVSQPGLRSRPLERKKKKKYPEREAVLVFLDPRGRWMQLVSAHMLEPLHDVMVVQFPTSACMCERKWCHGGPGLSPAADGSPIERAHVQCVRAGTAHVRATRSFCTVNIPRRVSAVAGFPVGAALVTPGAVVYYCWRNIHKVFRVGEMNTWPVCSLKAQRVRFSAI